MSRLPYVRLRRSFPILQLLLLLLVVLTPYSSSYEQYLFSGASSSSKTDKDTSPASALSNVPDLDKSAYDNLKTQGEPWAIMFYSPTCGHCQHFAPTWAAVSEAIESKEGLGGLSIGAVSCVAEPGVCQDENVNSYPTLKGFGLPEGKGEGVVTREQTVKKLVKWLTDKYTAAAAAAAAAGGAGQTSFSIDDDGKTSSSAANAAAGAESRNTRTTAQGPGEVEAEAKLSLGELKRARVEDAFTSLRFALDHDVFLGSKVLREEGLGSLKDLLHVLSLLFPGKKRRVAFRGLLESVYPLQELSIKEWEAFLAVHLDPLAPTVPAAGAGAGAAGKGRKKDYKWVVCKSEAGYTCGLWILFHLLSVKSAVRAESKAASSSTSIISPPYVMRVIKGFVSHFFGCQDCREHFLGAYQEGKARWEGGREEGKGVVWWVWWLHDKVNVRLGKRRWPTKEGCRECWREGGRGDEEPEWEAVYRVMVEEYDVHDTELRGEGGGEGGREEGLGELAALSRDYVFLSGFIVVLCAVFCLRMREKFRTGRRKKRGDTMLPL
jgi:thiol oxidase